MDNYTHEEEAAWKRARELAWEIYALTNKAGFGDDHQLRDSIRRSSFTIMATIGEGFEQGASRDFMRYLVEAREEIEDLRYQLATAYQRHYINGSQLDPLDAMISDLGCMLSNLMTHLNVSLIDVDVSLSDHNFKNR